MNRQYLWFVVIAFFVGGFMGKQLNDTKIIHIAKNNKIVETDTVYVSTPSLPDTIETEVIKYIVKRDTIENNIVITKVDTIREYTYMSTKSFKWPYINSTVYSWANSPINKVANDVEIDWYSHFKDTYYPKFQSRLKSTKKKGRIQGFVTGIVSSAVLVYLLK